MRVLERIIFLREIVIRSSIALRALEIAGNGTHMRGIIHRFCKDLAYERVFIIRRRVIERLMRRCRTFVA